MKKLFLFLVLVLAGCAGGFRFGPRGFSVAPGLEETTPTPSPCKDFDLSAVPPEKQVHAQKVLKLLDDQALTPADRAELQRCLCEYLENLQQ